MLTPASGAGGKGSVGSAMPVALLRGLLSPEEVARVVDLGGTEQWPDAPAATARCPTLSPELESMAYHVGLQV